MSTITRKLNKQTDRILNSRWNRRFREGLLQKRERVLRHLDVEPQLFEVSRKLAKLKSSGECGLCCGPDTRVPAPVESCLVLGEGNLDCTKLSSDYGSGNPIKNGTGTHAEQEGLRCDTSLTGVGFPRDHKCSFLDAARAGESAFNGTEDTDLIDKDRENPLFLLPGESLYQLHRRTHGGNVRGGPRIVCPCVELTKGDLPGRDPSYQYCEVTGMVTCPKCRGKLSGVVGSTVVNVENRGEHPASQSNLYSVLDGVDMDGCTRISVLKGRARALVRWYRQMGLPQERDIPLKIECGGLRSAVRQCFPSVLDTFWEFSFKTIQKVERDCCDDCRPRFESKLNEWILRRSQPVEIDNAHLERFEKHLEWNVAQGWDNERSPFIPNGNATEAFKRREGGNWNREEFSDTARVELVFSSGKPRVVTMYSSRNTEILAPLHYSLYSKLKRKGWLLVGDPTEKHLSKLEGTEWLSMDYESATDNIKTVYVQKMVEVLLRKAESISEEEAEALRVLSTLKVDGMEGPATRGQPMGSVMSFPLLCLMNKTCFDMSLTDLLERKEISFQEWSSHRCLINGDDLLTREIRKAGALRAEIVKNGQACGLVVNQEKTLSHDQKAEVNSTLFVDGIKVGKKNVSALWMKPDVEDVLGFAYQATCGDRADFTKVVRANAHILAKQQDKKLYMLPPHLQAICRKDRKIRRAMVSSPESIRPVREGVIRMVERPEGYDLSREEEFKSMSEEVERLREQGLARAKERSPCFRTNVIRDSRSYRSNYRRPLRNEKELIPLCFSRSFHLKHREYLLVEEVAAFEVYQDPPYDGPTINHMIDMIRVRKDNAVRTLVHEDLGDFVGL